VAGDRVRSSRVFQPDAGLITKTTLGVALQRHLATMSVAVARRAKSQMIIITNGLAARKTTTNHLKKAF
jgi:hypothetical protein